MKLYRKRSDIYALALVVLALIISILELIGLSEYSIIIAFLYFCLFLVYEFIITKKDKK